MNACKRRVTTAARLSTLTTVASGFVCSTLCSAALLRFALLFSLFFSCRHIFGLKSDVSSGIHYLEDNCVIYPAGHNIVLYSTDTKTQRFIHGSDVNGPQGRTEICGLAVSPNKRYVAVAERGVERGLINVYDVRTLKKKKTLYDSINMKSKEYVSLCFSPDSKHILSQGGAPDWTLINWMWGKTKPVQTISLLQNLPASMSAAQAPSITQVSFCPSDPSILCATGKHALLFFRIDTPAPGAASAAGSAATKLRPIEPSLFGRPANEDYTCHAWVGSGANGGGSSRRLIVGTADGQLLYLDNAQLRGTLRTTQDQDMAEMSLPIGGRGQQQLNASAFSAPRSIESLVAYSHGFVAGCDSGVVKSYVLDADDDSYVLRRSFHIDEHQKAKVKSIGISPSDEHLVVATEDQQCYSLRHFHSDVLKAEDMRFEPLSVSFHTGPITGLDVCVRKPIVVTCGQDKTIRVWNYITKTLELKAEFAEVPLCIALHPSGLHVLVGFSDKLRLMNLLMDDIRGYKEFVIKSCSEVQFSHGGHMFAAMNIGLIQVYNTYTCELLWTFRGHTLAVKSLYWSLDDTNIVSAGLDGAVYERKIGQTARTQELVQKGCKFTSALCTEDNKIYAVGDDRMLKEILDKNINKTLDAGVILTQLVVSHPPQRMLFAGTINGVIRSFAFPLTGVVKDYQCHHKTVSRMRMTHDDAFLFSVSEDGCLAIFNVKEREGRIPKNERPDRVPFSDEVLVTKSDLEEKNALMSELRAKVDELTASNEYQIRLHDINHQEKLKEISEKYGLQIEHDRSKIDMMRDEKQELEMEFEEKITQLKLQHSQVLHLNDLEHQKAIMREVARFQRLQTEMEKEAFEYANLKAARVAQHRSEYSSMKAKYESILAREINESRSEHFHKASVTREFVETKDQLEVDIDKEVEQLKDKFDARLATERDATLRLKGENGIMRKKFKALQKDIDDQTENIRTMYEKEEHLLLHIKNLEERIHSHKSEIKDRDKTIGESERAIYDLKKDNQELEKFKFVLDYQIKELKRQIEPRENEIADMKEQVASMDIQLELFHRENGSRKQEVIDLQAKLASKMNHIRTQRQMYRQTQSELSALSNDLSELVVFIQEPLTLKDAVKRCYQTHVTEKIQATEIDPDVSKEYKRQKAYLDKSVDVLKKKLSRDLLSRRNDNMRLMQENVALIKEINKLRREIKLMQQVQRQKELNTATKPNQPMEQDQWNEQERSDQTCTAAAGSSNVHARLASHCAWCVCCVCAD